MGGNPLLSADCSWAVPCVPWNPRAGVRAEPSQGKGPPGCQAGSGAPVSLQSRRKHGLGGGSRLGVAGGMVPVPEFILSKGRGVGAIPPGSTGDRASCAWPPGLRSLNEE